MLRAGSRQRSDARPDVLLLLQDHRDRECLDTCPRSRYAPAREVLVLRTRRCDPSCLRLDDVHLGAGHPESIEQSLPDGDGFFVHRRSRWRLASGIS